MNKFIAGKNINLRDIEVDDAEFILSLRVDESKSKYLNKTENNLEKQINYIESYKKANKDHYFIIEAKDGQRLGSVRIYDIKEDSFCWGSWLIVDGAPSFTAIESALLIYEYAFYQLGFKKSHFDVRKGNERVISFHQRFGAKIVYEDELDYFFNYTKEDYEAIRDKYKKFRN